MYFYVPRFQFSFRDDDGKVKNNVKLKIKEVELDDHDPLFVFFSAVCDDECGGG